MNGAVIEHGQASGGVSVRDWLAVDGWLTEITGETDGALAEPASLVEKYGAVRLAATVPVNASGAGQASTFEQQPHPGQNDRETLGRPAG